MKTLETLTTEELETTKALFTKYATLEEHVRCLDHAEKPGKKAACTKAFNKLNNYLQTFATEKEASNIIFNLTNA